MNRSVKSWLRRVYPPWWLMGIVLLSYLMLESFRCWVVWAYDASDIALQIKASRDGTIIVCCGLYTAYRVMLFHPAFMRDYAAWLSLTPWTHGKPLPKGPVHLVAQDFVLLAVAIALSVGSPNMIHLVPIALFAVYLVISTVALVYTACRPYAYLLAFGLGLAVYLYETPRLAAVLLILLYGPAYLGLRQSLKRFPWPLVTDGRQPQKEIPLGWPHTPLFLKEQKYPLKAVDRIAISLLAGWWCYVLTNLSPPIEQSKVAMGIFSVLTMIAIAARIIHYCINYGPPISFLGRLWTGRWIIPGYDRVFLAPLCAGLVFVLTLEAHYVIGLTNPSLCAMGLSTVLLIILLMGPSHRSWALTGSHRMIRAARNGQTVRTVRR